MVLKAVHDSQEEIPEQYQDLYSERDGKWELTGIQGVKTTADIGRIQASLDNEKAAHKATKEKFAPWADLGDFDEVQQKLDRIPELEAASKGKLDESELQDAVDRRVEATIRTRLAPVERENNKLKAQIEDSTKELSNLRTEKVTRTIHDSLDGAMGDLKVPSEYRDDVRMWGERVFEVNEDGQVLTRDNVGVTPGVEAKSWLEEMVQKRPAWAPPTRGTNSRGSGVPGGMGGENPWSRKHWNVTKQAQYAKEKGTDKAREMAAQAGAKYGSLTPPPEKG